MTVPVDIHADTYTARRMREHMHYVYVCMYVCMYVCIYIYIFFSHTYIHMQILFLHVHLLGKLTIFHVSQSSLALLFPSFAILLLFGRMLLQICETRP